MLNRLALRTKLYGAFTVALVILAAMGLLSLLALNSLDEAATDMDRTATINRDLDRFMQQITTGSSAAFEYVITGDQQTRELYEPTRAETLGHLDAAQELTSLANVQAFVSQMRPRAEQHFDLLDELFDIRDDVGIEEAFMRVNDGDIDENQRVIEQAYLDLMVERDIHMAAREEQAHADAERGQLAIFVGGIVALLVVGSLAFILTRQITSQVARSADDVSSSADELASVSTQMAAAAEETTTQANVVASAGEQVSQNVAAVATAVEEMTATVHEIAGNANEASQVSSEAVQNAEEATRIVGELGDSSAQIGAVIEVITSIAEQTSLLALNATIEAARAGDAGKGFAVVANEVKDLANQTANATEDISQRIAAIQQDSSSAVGAIERIDEVIDRIADISTTIASAVEEQSATTNEISRNINEVAIGSSQIAENITSVAQAAQDTSEAASRTHGTALGLTHVAQGLREVIDGHATQAAPSERSGSPSTNGHVGRPDGSLDSIPYPAAHDDRYLVNAADR